MPAAATRSLRRYVITGGPGAGKSTLLQALAAAGYHCYEEASRRLIREQMAARSGVLPWLDMGAFAALALDAMKEQHDDAAEVGGTCFFDRAIPDVFGYLMHAGLEVPQDYLSLFASCRYEPVAFLLPPWREIFVQDRERPQTYSESEELYEALREVYGSLGFRLVELPRASVAERAGFVFSLTG
ncbi:AAA family ATPase [Prosthecochloris sp. N3]|uniref:AAA family ATPase n=1 Tax=Prosthecochloris ethylica TaxID=2743976 RepID=A0ABR9XSD4_9CHLB|nr:MULTISPECIES: AAA family ATPase [Prosthecochloris]MEC9487795.1 AAA family ATPase [Prosthecochloris sp.]MBF0586909.1 AAA family ATPase [Prosthecochloris ethylica]MBF0636743.1 AAA family ATPase [Prosthecochloris ethylica]NUK48419.1 AAA family ATPase [Prosthecochloris ethylica]RNA64258.1 hypothetical protein CR163_002755 [Prosthecochloris sp. ZM_2]